MIKKKKKKKKKKKNILFFFECKGNGHLRNIHVAIALSLSFLHDTWQLDRHLNYFSPIERNTSRAMVLR